MRRIVYRMTKTKSIQVYNSMKRFRDWYKKRHTEVFSESEEMIYKGFRIEPYSATNVGYSSPSVGRDPRTNRSIIKQKTRKDEGYLIYYPDSDASKFFKTLRAAKQYIDDYMG